MDRAARILAVGLTAVGIAAGVSLRAAPPFPEADVRLDRVPLEADGWNGAEVAVAEKTRRQLGSDALLLRAYRRDEGPPVWLYVDYHRVQRLGSTVHSPRVCYPGSGWSVEEAEVSVLYPEGGPPACWLDLSRRDERMLAVYWYESRWGVSARETTLKVHVARSALARRESDVVLFRASTPVLGGDEESARGRLLDFVAGVGDSVRAALPFGEWDS
ncbi:EpsI family protein [bacterium]|nr:EpsI family protein [bacterium]